MQSRRETGSLADSLTPRGCGGAKLDPHQELAVVHSLEVRVLDGRAAAPLNAPRGAIHPVAHACAQPELELTTLPLHQQNDLLPCSQHRQISANCFSPQ